MILQGRRSPIALSVDQRGAILDRFPRGIAQIKVYTGLIVRKVLYAAAAKEEKFSNVLVDIPCEHC